MLGATILNQVRIINTCIYNTRDEASVKILKDHKESLIKVFANNLERNNFESSTSPPN